MRKFQFLIILLAITSCLASAVHAAGDTVDSNKDYGAATLNDGWWSMAKKHLVESEYNVTMSDRSPVEGVESSYQAPNRAYNFRTYFMDDRIVITSRKSEEDWKCVLTPEGYGRGKSFHALTRGAPAVFDNRVEYDCSGLTEWYLNSDSGLEQGFTIVERLAGASGESFWIEMKVSGDLTFEIAPAGDSINFYETGGRLVLQASDLYTIDSGGAELECRFDYGAERDRLRIMLEDQAAEYPVFIDPSYTAPIMTPLWEYEGEQNNEYLGYSTASAGDVNADGYADVIVGAPNYDTCSSNVGRVFVFHGSSAGPEQSPSWTKYGPRSGSRLGHSVNSAGDVNNDGYDDVIIGSISASCCAPGGEAYVYHGSASGLNTTAGWNYACSHWSAEFGYSLASAGDVNQDDYADVIVGAPLYDNDNSGRVYVFHGSASGLESSYNWDAEGGQYGERFGEAVSSAGDVDGDGYADVIVGAPGYSNCGEYGRVYVYKGSASGLYSTPFWTESCDEQGSEYGTAVSSAGDFRGDGCSDIIVGAKSYGCHAVGRVFYYNGRPTGIYPNRGFNGPRYGEFGSSLSYGRINDDNYDDIIVGMKAYNENEGAVFVFYGATFGLEYYFNPDCVAYGKRGVLEELGWSVGAGDFNGDGLDDIIAGSRLHSVNGNDNEGKATVYNASNFSQVWMKPIDNWHYEGPQEGEMLGFSIGSAGDVNADGYEDIVVGAPYYDICGWNVGRAFVFHGRRWGLNWNPSWSENGIEGHANFGYSVGTAGDVDNDGYDDVIIGASGSTNEHQGGAAYVYHGRSTGLDGMAYWIGWSDSYDADYGCSVSTAGDVNNDGYADVVVGARYGGNSDAGYAYGYHGSSSGLSYSPAWEAGNFESQERFGWSVSDAGDVNADGYADVIVGAPDYDSCGCGQVECGHAYVFHGTNSGLESSYSWRVSGDDPQGHCFFGNSVSTAGDVNADGYDDVVVGAKNYDNYGGAFAYLGSSSGLNSTPVWQDEGDEWYDYGYSVSSGNMNNDAYDDIIVGMQGYDNNNGAVFVYYGSSTGPETSPYCFVYGSNKEYLGAAVDSADVDEDDFDEVIVGAYGYDNYSSSGRVSYFKCLQPTPLASPTRSPITSPQPTATRTPFVTQGTTTQPTPPPTTAPTQEPSPEPTDIPTAEPTDVPTQEPTDIPTAEPTEIPTQEPTNIPTEAPTEIPTQEPSPEPTDIPTQEPTAEPTTEPSPEPTGTPTETPTFTHSPTPTAIGTSTPTPTPTDTPTPVPDLKVRSQDIDFDPSYPDEGEATTVTATVWNYGDAACGTFTVRIYADYGAGPVQIGSDHTAGPLNPGESDMVSETWTAACGAVISAEADIFDEVTESNESNNAGSRNAPIMYCPGSVTMSVIPETTEADIGEEVEYQIQISNGNLGIDTFDIEITGSLPSGWYEVSPDPLVLNAGQTNGATMTVNVPDECSSVGDYSFQAAATSLQMGDEYTDDGYLTVSTDIAVTQRNPANGTTTGSNDVTFNWHSSVPADSTLFYRELGAPAWTEASVGVDVMTHQTEIGGLERNATYEWYAELESVCGNTTTDTWTFTIGNGVVFTEDSYTFTVERDYDQHVWVGVHNEDDVAHTVELHIDNPNDELIVNFVGPGSEDETVNVSPGETRDVELVIHAQDVQGEGGSKVEVCFDDLMISLTADEAGAPITDAAPTTVCVTWPYIAFSLTEEGSDPVTEVKYCRVSNSGDALTDLSVNATDDLTGRVLFIPRIDHYRLENEDQIDFDVEPLFESGQPSLSGQIAATAAGEEVLLPLNFDCASPRSLWEVVVAAPELCYPMANWFCTNRPSISMSFEVSVNALAEIDTAVVYTTFQPRSGVRPHYVDILMNGNLIGELDDIVPSGTYGFAFDPGYLNVSPGGSASNTLSMVTQHFNGGHYVVSTNSLVVLTLEDMTLNVCAHSQTEADALAPDLPSMCAGYTFDLDPRVQSVTVLNMDEEPTSVFYPGETAKIRIRGENPHPFYSYNITYTLKVDTDGDTGTAEYDTHVTGEDWITTMEHNTDHFHTWHYTVPAGAPSIQFTVEAHETADYANCWDCPGWNWNFDVGGGITGYVREAGNSDPIEGASVSTNDGYADQDGTDENGYYEILRLPNRDYDVTAGAEGFAPQTVSGITVNGSILSGINFDLTTPTVTPTLTVTPTPTVTTTPTLSATPTLSPTPTLSSTPTISPTATSSPTEVPTDTPTEIPTMTPTSPTPTQSPTPTAPPIPVLGGYGALTLILTLGLIILGYRRLRSELNK